MGSGVWNIKNYAKLWLVVDNVGSRFQGIYMCAHKTATLTSIQTLGGGGKWASIFFTPIGWTKKILGAVYDLPAD